MADTQIVESLREKIFETIERTQHLVSLASAQRLDWHPGTVNAAKGFLDLGHLMGHLLECLSGFCAVFYAAFPEKMGYLSDLRSLEVNHCCTAEEANRRIQEYARWIAQAFDVCKDSDLTRVLPTVFDPAGETVAMLLLGNLEHLINHKYQLFFYLKMQGMPVGSRDLYHWRGPRQDA